MGGVVSARTAVIDQGIVLYLAVLARPKVTAAGASDRRRVSAVSAPTLSSHRTGEPGPVRFGPPAEQLNGEGDADSDRIAHSVSQLLAREARVEPR